MTISVDWANTQIITVEKSDMTLIQAVPTVIYQLDLDTFRLTLRDLEDDPDGRPWPKTHTHNTTVDIGGVTLARVLEILPPYTITFEDDQYAVNLVGANSNVGDRINVNQVSVRSANSAGLVDLEILIAGAYQGHVVVDQLLGQAGTDEPIGTFKVPSNNMIDALLIAEKQGVRRFTFLRNTTLVEDYSAGYTFEGISPFIVVTINDIADVTGCAMKLMTLQGQLDGLNTVRDCAILDVTDASGFFEQCSFMSTLTSNGALNLFNCFSQVAGGGYPSFDIGSNSLVVRGHKGSFGLTNAQVGHVSSIGLSEGRFIADATCVGGEVHVRNQPFRIDDTSGVGCDIIDDTESFKMRAVYGQVTRFIHVNTEALTNGNGDQQTPFNILNDAVDFMESEGLLHLVVLADITINRNLKNFTILGTGVPTIDIVAGSDLGDSIFQRCKITGSYVGEIQATECAIINLVNMSGTFLTCSMAGTMEAAPNANLLISRVAPAVPAQPWTISMNSGQSSIVGIHNSSGGVIVTNMDNAGDILHFNGSQGEIVFGATNTLGNAVVTGSVLPDISNNGGTTIDKIRVTSQLVYKDIPKQI